MSDSIPKRQSIESRRNSGSKTLRFVLGLLAIISIAAYVHSLGPVTFSNGWTVKGISGIDYALTTILWCFVGYLAGRCFFSKYVALSIAIVCCAIASEAFARRKIDDYRLFVLFGVAIAVSAFVALGWLDRGKSAFLRSDYNSAEIMHKGKNKEKNKSLERTGSGMLSILIAIPVAIATGLGAVFLLDAILPHDKGALPIIFLGAFIAAVIAGVGCMRIMGSILKSKPN